MENNTNSADFRFAGYKVVKSVIEFNGDIVGNKFSVNIDPSGIKDGKSFFLKLDVSVEDECKSYSVFVSMIGRFEFDENVDRLPDFFTVNAPAILFPYVRAYISSLTSASGVDTVIIPTLNLISLKESLSENITDKNLS